MLILPGGSVPIFLSGLNPDPEVTPTYPSQLKTFDVYYNYEPVVGVHIIAEEPQVAPLALHVVGNN